MTTDPASAAADGFNPTIHAPNRLKICAALHAAGSGGQVEFATVQDKLQISASVLSKQVSTLVGEGYVHQNRATRDHRQRVWLSLTKEGRAAYEAHVAALRAIVEG
ncbi:transcriptional regulator [Nocardiopsis suaedae]|uniref:Transcriptional regulator n=1 Tax=Nocardiopsis suaedae TaxID=3018444 RepID=A0ABT4TEP9_9ACTN|nr:transcriptional regulator [Nocardiopsis suaedae]MDA2803182.1 transcriptional regulator [Nocardiopsis suaedae]